MVEATGAGGTDACELAPQKDGDLTLPCVPEPPVICEEPLPPSTNGSQLQTHDDGDLTLPCVPDTSAIGEVPRPPSINGSQLQAHAWRKSDNRQVWRACRDSSYADLKVELHAMIFKQKLELQQMAERHTKALTSAIETFSLQADAAGNVSTADTLGAATSMANNNTQEHDIDEDSDQAVVNRNPSMQRGQTLSSFLGYWQDKKRKLKKRVSLSREKKIQSQLGVQLDTAFWDTAIGIIIVLNGILMLVESEWMGWKNGVDLGTVGNDELTWRWAPDFFQVLEHLFTLIFLVELVVKLYVLKRAFIKEFMNLFDAVLVASSVLNMYIFPLVFDGRNSTFDNLTILRVMRMARLMRTFRMLRTLKLFAGLRVLVKSCSSCIISLTWSMVLLTIFMMVGAIMMVSLLEEFVINESNEYEHRLWAWEHYGTSMRATYTMFEVTLSGCWPNYVRPLLKEVSWSYSIVFIIYVIIVVFAVIRIITAIFLKETMDAANGDADMLITERARKREYFVKKLAKVFKVADGSDDGTLTEEEFNNAMESPIVKQYMNALELEVHEGNALFQLLSNGNGEISIDDFIKGVSRLKGQARSVDVIAIQMDSQKILKQVQEVRGMITQLGVPFGSGATDSSTHLE